jgi:hypothetical protein
VAASLNLDWLIGEGIGVLNGGNPIESPDVLKQLEHEGYRQVVTVRPWEFTMAWRIPDCRLRNFMFRATEASNLSDHDLFMFNEFCVYELAHNRQVPIWFEDERVKELVVSYISRFFAPGQTDLDNFVANAMTTQQDRYKQLPPTYLQHSGCLEYCHESCCSSDLVCHATSVRSAAKIIQGGRILSAVKATGLAGKQLAEYPANAAGDPPDYFDYIMFAAGNCTAVDKLVMERAVGYPPSWEEFENAFQPGIRFYFVSDDLRSHPNLTLDGIHVKIHEELLLDPWLALVAIPTGLDGSDELIELAHLRLPPDKIALFPFNGRHYKDWASMVYSEARARNARRIMDNLENAG